MPQTGDTAPDFEAPIQGGGTVRLSDYAGQHLALFFYPRDNTPGCTTQACNLRDHLADLQAAGVAVVGVSPDGVASHEKFAARFNLPFPLLADPDKVIINAYGVWGEKNMYGRKTFGLKRTTFLIGPDGTIEKVFKRPKVMRHAEEILAVLSG